MRRTILVSIVVLSLAVMIQTSIIARVNLLNGSGDIVLLFLAAWGLQERVRGAWISGVMAGLLVGLISGNPWYIYLICYMGIVGLARILAHRVWQAPLLAMFTVTLTGTLVLHLLTYLARSIFELPLDFNLSFVQIILPSVLLNLLLAIPIHALIHDLANRVFPAQVVT